MTIETFGFNIPVSILGTIWVILTSIAAFVLWKTMSFFRKYQSSLLTWLVTLLLLAAHNIFSVILGFEEKLFLSVTLFFFGMSIMLPFISAMTFLTSIVSQLLQKL